MIICKFHSYSLICEGISTESISSFFYQLEDYYDIISIDSFKGYQEIVKTKDPVQWNWDIGGIKLPKQSEFIIYYYREGNSEFFMKNGFDSVGTNYKKNGVKKYLFKRGDLDDFGIISSKIEKFITIKIVVKGSLISTDFLKMVERCSIQCKELNSTEIQNNEDPFFKNGILSGDNTVCDEIIFPIENFNFDPKILESNEVTIQIFFKDI
jgi:hypothetical protein